MSEEQFQKALEVVEQMREKNAREGGERLSDDELLQFYGFYKQATVGNIDTQRPGFLSLNFKAKYKWDAWKAREGMSKEEARKQYIALVKKSLTEHGYGDLIKGF
mgnify:CR=1 FL=1